ncbi:MAG: hypothetical protein H5U16_02010 [Roseovarius sp.]|nr:hypothetical protein [Roseovarius sp.]
MFILVVIGWLGIGAGALAVFAGINGAGSFWIASGLSGAISGILFLALDKGLTLLREIRDALTGAPVARGGDPPARQAGPSSWDKAFLADD